MLLRPIAIAVLALLPTAHAFVGPVVTPTLSHTTSTTSVCKSIGKTTTTTSSSSSSSSSSRVPTWNKKRTCSQLSPSLLTEAVSQYQLLLRECPLPTQCVTSSILAGFGDVLAQTQQSSIRQVKRNRLLNFMIKGFGGGIIWALWFAVNEQWTTHIIDMILPLCSSSAILSGPVVTMARTVVSILLEQFLAVPIIYTLWDIPLPILLSSTRDNRSIPLQIQKTLPGLLWDNAKVWTFANVLVYTAPLEYRVLVSSLVDVAWQSIVSSHVMTTTTTTTTTPAEMEPTKIRRVQPQQDHDLLESIMMSPRSQPQERNPNFLGNDRQPQTAEVLP
jgi:hypothetical protein